MEAIGIHKFADLKLGGIVGPEAQDKRTIRLASFMNTDMQAPISFDFDRGRTAFPSHVWGNDQYGDCECAGRANLALRLQRKQIKKTLPLDDNDVISLYKRLTGCVSPGDNNDTGMTTVDNLNDWRRGWTISKEWVRNHPASERTLQIDAYGYINPQNSHLLRLAIYLFSGVLMGVNLPINAQRQFDENKVWDIDPSGGPDSEPGGWGGHCVAAKRYDADNVYVLTWGQEVRCTNAWINKYAEESYAVVDSLDSWVKYPQALDVTALITQMQSAGINVQR